MTRVEMDKVEAMVEDSKQNLEAAQAQATGPLADDPISDTISFDDFAKIDLAHCKNR